MADLGPNGGASMSLFLAQTMFGTQSIPFPPTLPPQTGLKTLMFDWWDFENNTTGEHAGNSANISTPTYVAGKIGVGVNNGLVAPGAYTPWNAAYFTVNAWMKLDVPISGSTVISLINSQYHDDNTSNPTRDSAAGLHIDFVTGQWGIFKTRTGGNAYALEGPTAEWVIPQGEWFMVTLRFRNSDDYFEVGINGNMSNILNGYLAAPLPWSILNPLQYVVGLGTAWLTTDMVGLWSGGSAMSNAQVQQLAAGGNGISYSDIP